MSHFAVAVIVPEKVILPELLKNNRDFNKIDMDELVSKQLAPYQEYECSGCDPEYLEAVDETSNYIDTFFRTRGMMIVDGKLGDPSDFRSYRAPTEGELKKIKNHEIRDYYYDGEKYFLEVYPDNAKKVQIPFCYDESFTAFFLSDFNETDNRFVRFGETPDPGMDCYIMEIAEPGKAPEKQFDGYELLNKEEIRQYILRTYRVVNVTNPNAKWDWYSVGGRWDGCIPLKEKVNGHAYSNYAFVKNIAFDRIDQNKYDSAIRDWEITVENSPMTEEEKKTHFSLWNADYYISHYGSKENYAIYMATFSTYAFIDKDKGWNAPGEMGWFGASTEDRSSLDAYRESFHRYLTECSPHDLLVVVDCHT
jgi:hypothetical protein